MRRQPIRSSDRGMSVSERFNDGICRIFSVTDSAQPGYQPKPVYDLKCSLNYRELRLGIQRYYAAMQAHQRIDMVIRVPQPSVEISPADMVQLHDGRQYRVELVQIAEDIYPAALDLTLSRIAHGGDCDDMG